MEHSEIRWGCSPIAPPFLPPMPGCPKLGESNFRSLGHKHNSGVQNRILGTTPTDSFPYSSSFLPEGYPFYDNRSPQAPTEGGNICGANILHQGFVSRIFLVPKKDGFQRPVISLCQLSQFVVWEHFKMENTHLVENIIIKEGNWMIKIDLKYTYFSISIHQERRQWLRFQWQQQLYQFQCLPLACPQLFGCSPKRHGP